MRAKGNQHRCQIVCVRLKRAYGMRRENPLYPNAKVIEKHVVKNITNHLLEHDFGEPLQSAYSVAHSTETAFGKV